MDAFRIVLVLVASYLTAVEGYHCSSDEFEYSTGQCIHYTRVCDGFYDCLSFYSDENNCGPCYSSEYRCSNGYCILYSQRCDGYNDCGDNSDEHCGSSVIGLAVGLCFLALFLLVVVVVVAVGGGSYRRSRQRRLLRTAPLVTVHPPPPSTATVTHTIPPPEQLTSSSTNYPALQPNSPHKDYPPPYSAVAGTTDLGISRLKSEYPQPANQLCPPLSPAPTCPVSTPPTPYSYPHSGFSQPPNLSAASVPPPPSPSCLVPPAATAQGAWPAPTTNYSPQ